MADLSGTILDGKYELKRIIGEGGMGSVYEAVHLLIGRRLAVKILLSQYVTSKEVVTRFQREAQAAAAIGHEHIVDVTDMGTASDGTPYIVMEYLEGTDLKHLLAETGPLSPARAAYILAQALSALSAAHAAGIIHRDLKPENIYLISKIDHPDYVKLLDFGISKFKSLESEDAKGLTQTGTVLGTPYYMSPEQARGEQNLTLSSDIYAMGVILYQMMTGKLPFDAPNYNALLITIITEDPIPPEVLNPTLPAQLANIIKKAMSRAAKERFKNCDEFKTQLLSFLPSPTGIRFETDVNSASRAGMQAGLSTKTQTPLEMSQTKITTPRSRALFYIGGASVVAAAIIVVLFFGGFIGKKEVPLIIAPVPAPDGPGLAGDKPQEVSAKESESSDVQIKISARPGYADITIDNKKISGNPFVGVFAKDNKLHNIVIGAEGYQTETSKISFQKDLTLTYELKLLSEGEENTVSPSTQKSGSVHKTGAQKTEKPSGSAKKKIKRKIDSADPWK